MASSDDIPANVLAARRNAEDEMLREQIRATLTQLARLQRRAGIRSFILSRNAGNVVNISYVAAERSSAYGHLPFGRDELTIDDDQPLPIERPDEFPCSV
jgi:hypothetical protein